MPTPSSYVTTDRSSAPSKTVSASLRIVAVEEHFTFSDPRQRAPDAWSDTAVRVDWSDLRKMWRALHSPNLDFCADGAVHMLGVDELRQHASRDAEEAPVLE